jgi:hypothetical protein
MKPIRGLPVACGNGDGSRARKAAVYEYGQALVAEDEVGAANQGLVPTPARDAGGAKERCQL